MTVVHLFLSNRHKFLAEFLEVGGILTVLEILGLKEAKEVSDWQVCMYAITAGTCKLNPLHCKLSSMS